MEELTCKGIKPCSLTKNAKTLYIIIPAPLVNRCELLEIPLKESLLDLFVDIDIENKSVKLIYETVKQQKNPKPEKKV